MKYFSIAVLALNLGFFANAQATQCNIMSISCDPVGPDGRVHSATVEWSGNCSRDQSRLAANDYCNCGHLVEILSKLEAIKSNLNGPVNNISRAIQPQ